MKADELVAMAASHGVDLLGAARLGRPKGKRKPGPIPNNRATGTATRTSMRPEWTMAELGQAAAGVPDLLFCAACYAFAGDRSQYTALQAALLGRAINIAKREDWPMEVLDIHNLPRPYIRHLCKLVLDEDANPHLFVVAPELYSIYLGISERAWDDHMQGRFDSLKGVWASWLGTACGMIQSKLRDNEFDSHDA
jgi:hypothetical protein